MDKPWLMGIDLGGSGARCLLVNQASGALVSASGSCGWCSLCLFHLLVVEVVAGALRILVDVEVAGVLRPPEEICGVDLEPALDEVGVCLIQALSIAGDEKPVHPGVDGGHFPDAILYLYLERCEGVLRDWSEAALAVEALGWM